MQESQVIEGVRAWLSSMVIGLNLCPFAESVFKANRIRYAVCAGDNPKDLLEMLGVELMRLVGADRAETETTLLVAPEMLPDFLDFNDFVGVGDQLLEDLSLSGTIQIVGFHPRFQFADATEDEPKNYTNRSPYPLLHLLREESISEVSSLPTDLMEIPRRNTATLERMGIEQILRRLKEAKR